MLGKKSQKSVEKRFLYSHEYREQKIGGKKLRNNFFRNTRIVRAKNVGRESSEISLKTISFICTRISCPKNKGEKSGKIIFPEKYE